MPRFEYSALSAAGDVVRGELEATNAAAAIARLHDQALLPIEAIEKRAESLGRVALRLWPARGLPGRELALASQQFARLLKAGLPLDRALEILASLAAKQAVARVLQDTLKRVQDGASLAEAMEAQGPAFPRSYVSMVRAGETGGALQGVLARLAEFLVRSDAMQQKVVSALIYPAILIVVATGSISTVLTVVLPQFEPFFREAGARLPTTTRMVMLVGDIAREDGWLMLLGLLGLVIAWQFLMRRPDIAMLRDRAVLGVPLLGDLVTKFEVGRFTRTLGVLLANGVAAPSALALGGAIVRNRALGAAVGIVSGRFKEGEGLSGPLTRTGRFPPLTTQLIRIGEETGRLEEMLEEVAEIYDQDVQRTLERLLAVLVPGLTVVMGLIVAVIVASIMLAMISIDNLAG